MATDKYINPNIVVHRQPKLKYLLIMLLTFSLESSSHEVNNLKDIYIKTNYFGVFFNAIRPFSGKEDAGNNITEDVFSFNTKERIEAGYQPKYTPGFAGSITVGYLLNDNIKFELEGLYSQINLYDEEYLSKDKARYIELRRNQEASKGAKCESPWRSGKVDINIQEACPVGITFKAAFKMRNKGFNNLAVLANVYYDFNKETMPFTSYVGAGLGLIKVKFLSKTRYACAYQAKLGVNYPLTTQAQAFIGLRYFGILGNQFKNIVSIIKIPAGEEGKKPDGTSFNDTARIESTTATITNRFGIYGLEFGLAYSF